MIDDISEQYEKELQDAIAQAEKQILKIYKQAMVQVSMKAYNVKLQDKPFSLSLYPLLNKFIANKVSSMHQEIYNQIVKSVTDAWQLANNKNDEFVDRRFAGKRKPVKGVKQILYDPNTNALESFIARKEKGLDLSKRVWNSVQPFKNELEQALGIGISKGKSATALATELKQYLNNPDNLFRRVRSEDGKLRLSKAAQSYHPGQGVYRSSYQNSLRLTRTENNIAYRSSDFERWQNVPFVLGTEIRLSAQHKFKFSHGRPVCEICEKLKGKYPKDFKFTGWHPSCICYQVPILMSEKEYSKYEDMLLGLDEFDISKLPLIKRPPAAFYDYLDKHGEQIAGWSNTPYWIRDNSKYIESSITGIPEPEQVPNKPTPKKTTGSLTPGGLKIEPQFTNISSDIKPVVQRALRAIDSVHGDGKLPNVPFTSSRVTSYEAAVYQHSFTNEILKVDLSKNAANPALSMIHEIGHMLDLSTLGVPNQFASATYGTLANQVVKAAKETETIKNIREILSTGVVQKDGRTFGITPRLRKHLKYLLQDHEIFARAYAQFIAQRTTDAAIKQQLLNKLNRKKDLGYDYQWDEQEFADIEKALEEMMIDKGWITN